MIKYIDGRNVPTYGEAVWHYPEGEYIYKKFYLKELNYNTSVLPRINSFFED